MNPRVYKEAQEHLLRAAMLIAPTGKVQHAFSDIANDEDFLKEDEPDKARVTALLSVMLDGLRFGNWLGQREQG